MNEQGPIHAYRILVTASDGSTVYWHKNGVLHEISPQLGPTWVTHFNKAIWLISPEGAFTPPGADPRAKPIVSVQLEAIY
jgi:hypothetical protein